MSRARVKTYHFGSIRVCAFWRIAPYTVDSTTITEKIVKEMCIFFSYTRSVRCFPFDSAHFVHRVNTIRFGVFVRSHINCTHCSSQSVLCVCVCLHVCECVGCVRWYANPLDPTVRVLECVACAWRRRRKCFRYSMVIYLYGFFLCDMAGKYYLNECSWVL